MYLHALDTNRVLRKGTDKASNRKIERLVVHKVFVTFRNKADASVSWMWVANL